MKMVLIVVAVVVVALLAQPATGKAVVPCPPPEFPESGFACPPGSAIYFYIDIRGNCAVTCLPDAEQ